MSENYYTEQQERTITRSYTEALRGTPIAKDAAAFIEEMMDLEWHEGWGGDHGADLVSDALHTADPDKAALAETNDEDDWALYIEHHGLMIRALENAGLYELVRQRGLLEHLRLALQTAVQRYEALGWFDADSGDDQAEAEEVLEALRTTEGEWDGP